MALPIYGAPTSARPGPARCVSTAALGGAPRAPVRSASASAASWRRPNRTTSGCTRKAARASGSTVTTSARRSVRCSSSWRRRATRWSGDGRARALLPCSRTGPAARLRRCASTGRPRRRCRPTPGHRSSRAPARRTSSWSSKPDDGRSRSRRSSRSAGTSPRAQPTARQIRSGGAIHAVPVHRTWGQVVGLDRSQQLGASGCAGSSPGSSPGRCPPRSSRHADSGGHSP